MTIQQIESKLIDPNRYQPSSRLNPPGADLEDLASIREIGFINTPKARPHPDRPGRVELIEGHRRVAAWQLFRPGEPVPLDIVECDDRQLFETMAIENAARKDLTAIEKALLVRDHMQRFGSPQAVAGKLVGLDTQGAVSNLLGLLELPEPIQALVANGSLPERFARRLRTLRTLKDDKALIRIATETAEHVEPDDDRTSTKEQVFINALYALVRQKCYYMSNAPWKDTWKPDQSVDIGDGKTTLPACKGCPDNRSIAHSAYCLRPSCWKAKLAQYAQLQAAQVAKDNRVSIVAPGEKVVIIEDPEQAKAVLASKSDAIRIAPKSEMPEKWWSADGATGSNYARVAVLASQADEILKTAKFKIANKKTPATTSISSRSSSTAASCTQKQSAFKDSEKRLRGVLESLTPCLVSKLPSDQIALALFVESIIEAGACYADQFEADQPFIKAWNKDTYDSKMATAKDLRVLAAHLMLSNVMQDLTYDDPARGLAQARARLANMNARYQLNFPPGWDAPLLPHSPLGESRGEGKSAKKSAKKSKAKK